jgi:hypothetical protein
MVIEQSKNTAEGYQIVDFSAAFQMGKNLLVKSIP